MDSSRSRSRSPVEPERLPSSSTSSRAAASGSSSAPQSSSRSRRSIANKFVTVNYQNPDVTFLKTLQWIPDVNPAQRKQKTSKVWEFMGRIIDADGDEFPEYKDTLFCKICLDSEKKSEKGHFSKVLILIYSYYFFVLGMTLNSSVVSWA